MQKGIIGKKLGMTQLFDENGKFIPVTVVEVGPCPVVMKKTIENDGYEAVQLGFSDVKEKKINKPQKGHFAKANVGYKRFLREFRLDDCAALNVGDEVKADIFADGDKIDVTGTSKGKGFAGVIKRWGNHRGPMTHGSGFHRSSGSMGACSSPSRVFKGKKLPGHMGNVRVTIQNLDVVKVMADKNLLLVKGSVPGPKGGILIIKDSVKK